MSVHLLRKFLRENQDKCIAVLGTTCVGKTTLMKDIPEAVSVSQIAPPLREEEKLELYKTPWTPETGERMSYLRGERGIIKAGKPAFGTVIPSNTELIVYLTVSDEVLKNRTELRGVSFNDAKAMQKYIEEMIKESKLPVHIIKI